MRQPVVLIDCAISHFLLCSFSFPPPLYGRLPSPFARPNCPSLSEAREHFSGLADYFPADGNTSRIARDDENRQRQD